MNSIIAFSLKDLGLLILWGLIVVMVVYIIRILINALSVVKQVKGIIADNENSVSKILDEAPGIANSVNRISDEVAHGMEAFRPTVDNSAEVSNSVTEEFKKNNDVIGKMSSVFHTISMGKNLYDHYFGIDVEPADEDTTSHS
ncbi:MAG: DUF948 domain-containing protein [Clostridia bacterium]|nr:DUF948 domain-containing protein [Clostridia bacterium]